MTSRFLRTLVFGTCAGIVVAGMVVVGARAERGAGAAAPAAFEVRATEYGFEAPGEVASGWVTYRLNNEAAAQVHEISLARLPEGRTHADYLQQVIPVWSSILARLESGELDPADAGGAAAELLPEWAGDITYIRSRGLVSPGRSTSNTHYLEPGEYVIDCWVKAPDGRLHIPLGMSRALTVTEAPGAPPPAAPDVVIAVRGGEVVVEGELGRGDQTIGIRSGEDVDAGNVHLVRLADDTDPQRVLEWMDWYGVDGLRAPAPVEFLGGVDLYGNTVPGDALASFTVEGVEPGRYAWLVVGPVGEAPGLLEAFEVD